RRQHGGGDGIHGDPRARRGTTQVKVRREGREARLRPVSVHRGRCCSREAQRSAMAVHRLRRSEDRRRSSAGGPDGQGRGARIRARVRRARRLRQDSISELDVTGALVGLDIGTTGVKAVAISPSNGAVVARAQSSYGLATPQPGWSEQDPEDWWRASQQALASLGVEPAGMGLSGQMHGLVVLDASDRVLRPAILWNDQRTVAECVEIEERIGFSRLIELSGNRAWAGFTAPKLLWLRHNEPRLYRQIASILLPKDYVRLRLLGERATDVADASGTLLFDVARRRWSEEVLAALDVRAEWLPQ